ncbi:MAG: zinc ribbon domain-containing protein [Desulfarculus sp.]|nr:zinc ribbon domain-containing protein [Desulfarculus sp.]
MPIYEFRCDSCQNVFEVLALSRGEQVQTTCPQCGGEELSRVLSTCSSIMGGVTASSQASQGPSLQSRSCGQANSCSTLTLPGYTR